MQQQSSTVPLFHRPANSMTSGSVMDEALVGLLDTANTQDLPTPSLSPSFPIKTPIYYSYLYGSEHESAQEFEGTEYDWGEDMVVFEQLDRYGEAFFSSSPPYVPFDYNTLNPDLDPDDSNYYVHVPEYEYVTLTDDEDDDKTMVNVDNDGKAMSNVDNDDEAMSNVDNDDDVMPHEGNDNEEEDMFEFEHDSRLESSSVSC
ncbi:unnamed protein product [Mortierella alpina]